MKLLIILISSAVLSSLSGSNAFAESGVNSGNLTLGSATIQICVGNDCPMLNEYLLSFSIEECGYVNTKEVVYEIYYDGDSNMVIKYGLIGRQGLYVDHENRVTTERCAPEDMRKKNWSMKVLTHLMLSDNNIILNRSLRSSTKSSPL